MNKRIVLNKPPVARTALGIEDFEIEGALPADEVSIVEDEIVDDVAALESMNVQIAQLERSIASLEDMASIVESTPNSTESEAALVDLVADMATQGTDLNHEQDVVPGLESFVGSQIAVEGIKETLDKMGRALRDSLVTSNTSWASLFKKYGEVGKSTKKALKASADSIKSAEGNTLESLSAKAFMSFGGPAFANVTSAASLISALEKEITYLEKEVVPAIAAQSDMERSVYEIIKANTLDTRPGFSKLVKDLLTAYKSGATNISKFIKQTSVDGVDISNVNVAENATFSPALTGNKIYFNSWASILSEIDVTADPEDGSAVRDALHKLASAEFNLATLPSTKAKNETLENISKAQLNELLDIALRYVDVSEKIGSTIDGKFGSTIRKGVSITALTPFVGVANAILSANFRALDTVVRTGTRNLFSVGQRGQEHTHRTAKNILNLVNGAVTKLS